MGKVVLDITTSLDGFVAGPDDGPDLPMGEGGERLHEWLFGLASWREPHGLEGGETNSSSEVLDEGLRASGAVVLGKRMFDNAQGWGDEPPFHKPVFVVTHTEAEPLAKQGGTTFTFVTDGVESAVEQAKAAAGDKDVSVAGGASIAQQCLRAGLLDELQIHVAPLLLGGGVRLFDDLAGEQIEVAATRVIESPGVTHLRYRVVR
jgi:dihydrofolate reductase